MSEADSIKDPEVLPPEEVRLEVQPGPSRREKRLLSFYDRLRERLVTAASRGRLPEKSVDYLLLAPDLFMLMARLSLDPNVPGRTKSLIGGALAYFLMPIDFFPEIVLGPGGFIDDLVLAAMVLSHVMSEELEPLAEKYWSGPQRLRIVLRDISRSANSLVGDGVYKRIKDWLGPRVR